MSSQSGSDVSFLDALSGAGGMADPAPSSFVPEVFPDALVAPMESIAPPVDMPRITVPELPDPKMLLPEDWDSDLNLPDEARVGPRASSAERAKAARLAMAARRDAAVGQSSRGEPAPTPAVAPARPATQAPMRVAATTGHQQPAPVRYPGPAQQQWAPPQQQWAPPQQQWAPPPAPQQQQQAQQQWAPPAPQPRPIQQRPGSGRRAPAAKQSKKSGGIGCLVFIVLIMVSSGLGRQLLDAIAELFNR